MKLMGKNLLDILATWSINLMILLGLSQVDGEQLLRIAVLIATLFFTIMKSVLTMKQWRKKKEIKEEE